MTWVVLRQKTCLKNNYGPFQGQTAEFHQKSIIHIVETDEIKISFILYTTTVVLLVINIKYSIHGMQLVHTWQAGR